MSPGAASLSARWNSMGFHFRAAGGLAAVTKLVSVAAARMLISSLPPNGLELTGDGGAAAGVRCSDVLGAGVLGLVAMALLPPYARDRGSSRCQVVHRAGGAR